MRPPRYAFAVPIQIHWGSASFEVRVRNISERGLFIETEMPLWIGATFVANLRSEPPLLLNCLVCHIEPNCGMGVEVGFPGEETEERYLSLVAEACSATLRN